MSSLLNNRAFHIVFLVYSAVLVFLGRQVDTGLMNFDDSFYAQKAKELLSSTSLLINTYHGQPDFDKPPLPLWLTAVAFKWFGISGYSAILVTGLFGAATVYVAYRFSENLFNDRWAAFLAGIILIFPGYFVDYARRAMVDVTLAFFITLALCALYQGKRNSKWYLVFGLATAGAILTKSVLGLFPLIIAILYFVWTRQSKEILNPLFLIGTLVALVLGGAWHITNWLEYGDQFIRFHFDEILISRYFGGDTAVPNKSPFYFLGYFIALFKVYWPWLPFTLAGFWVFGKRAVKENDAACRLLLLWVGVIFIILSLSRAQYLRYLLPIFPAMALITAKTISDWLDEKKKNQVLPYMVAIIMVTTLVINATPIEIQQATSLRQNSQDVRRLAPVIRLNTPETMQLRGYKIDNWNPRNALLFYTDRGMYDPTYDQPESVIGSFKNHPEAMWFTTVKEFKKLDSKFPGKLYLIQANGRYAFFTSAQYRDQVNYDFAKKDVYVIR